jgi:hypothetical protein
MRCVVYCEEGAAIGFNDFCLETVKVIQLGLPQGLLLSPVLYISFNLDLLIRAISAIERDIGFVDDHTAWVVGKHWLAEFSA